MIKKISKIIVIGLLALLVTTSFAHADVSNPNYFKKIGNVISFVGGYVFGSSTYPIANGYFTTLTVGNLIFNGVSLGNLVASGTATSTITGNGATSTFGGDISTNGIIKGRIQEISQTLTASSSVSWDLSLGGAATLNLLGGVTSTLATPTNMIPGGNFSLIVKQNNTTSSVLLFGSAYRFFGKSTPTNTMATSSVDIFTFISDGTYMYGSALNNF